MKLLKLTFGLLLAITIEMSVFMEMTVSRSESEEASELEVDDRGKLFSNENKTEMSRMLASIKETASNLAKKKKKTTKKTTTRSRKQKTQEDTTFYNSQNILTTPQTATLAPGLTFGNNIKK